MHCAYMNHPQIPPCVCFIDQNLCVRTSICTFPALFYAYACFINETPECKNQQIFITDTQVNAQIAKKLLDLCRFSASLNIWYQNLWLAVCSHEMNTVEYNLWPANDETLTSIVKLWSISDHVFLMFFNHIRMKCPNYVS